MKPVLKFVAVAAILLAAVQTVQGGEPPKEKFLITGYVNGSWVLDRVQDHEFLTKVDRLFFFGLSPDAEGRFEVSDKYVEALKFVKSRMKEGQELFLVVGGGGKVVNMHVMGDDSVKREAFVKELVKFAKEHEFDGIDMDWETAWRLKPAKLVDTRNLRALLTSIRDQMPEGYPLSAALGSQTTDAQQTHDILDLVEDVSIMIYSSLNKDGLHAPLYEVQNRMVRFTKAEVPNDRLMIGVPFYGKHPDKRTKVYRQLVDELNGDPSIGIHDGFSFNSVDEMKAKVKYMRENGYRGIMIWELTQDAPYSHPMSLLRAINQACGRE